MDIARFKPIVQLNSKTANYLLPDCLWGFSLADVGLGSHREMTEGIDLNTAEGALNE